MKNIFLPPSYQNTPEALQPYCDPARWEGHEINASAPEYLPVQRGGNKVLAWMALKKRLAGMQQYHPLERYQAGTVFDANELAPGAVVLFNREVLRTNKDTTFNPEVAATQEMLTSGLRPNLDGHEDSLIIVDTKAGAYSSDSFWGIVTPGPDKDEHRLVRVSTSMCSRKAQGETSVIPILIHTATTFEVGKVYGGSIANEKRALAQNLRSYQRINAIELAGVGGKKHGSLAKDVARSMLRGLGIVQPQQT